MPCYLVALPLLRPPCRELDDLLERRPVLPINERLSDQAERREADLVELRHRLLCVATRRLVRDQRAVLRPCRDGGGAVLLLQRLVRLAQHLVDRGAATGWPTRAPLLGDDSGEGIDWVLAVELFEGLFHV